jgi:hypothetical protein
VASLEAMNDNAAGYTHPDYVASLAEFGEPLHLPGSGGWLLRRRIGASDLCDAMGPYPLFFCRDWNRLGSDLAALADELVSVVVVTDPFAGCTEDVLSVTFDRVLRFKDHFVVALDRPPEAFVRKSHQAHARRALQSVEVDVCASPSDHLADWLRLFGTLSNRHAISGLRAFSPHAFEQQLTLPGLVMFRARAGDDVVGLDLWYVHNDVAYGHLAAFSDIGYTLRASYATKWTMLHYFWQRVRWVDLAGSAGATVEDGDGLAAFKRGWSTGTKPVFLCERVLQPEHYAALTAAASHSDPSYCPAYRAGEFL